MNAEGHTSSLADRALLALRACGRGDRIKVLQALEAMRELGTGARFEKALRACVDEGAGVQSDGHAFIVHDKESAARAAAAWSALDALRPAASAYFGGLGPPLLIDMRRSYEGISHCIHEIAGLGHIVVSGRCAEEEIPAVLAHELAHCHFRCHNRFLDEGVAVHFETAHVRERNFPAPPTEMDLMLARSCGLLPLAQLLRWRLEDVLPLGVAESGDAFRLVYAQAWKLIDCLMSRLGRERTLAACEAVGTARHEDIDAAFARSTGWSLDQASTMAFGPLATSDAKHCAEQPAAVDASETAEEARLRESLLHAPGDRQLSRELARLVLRRLIRKPPAVREFAHVRELLREVHGLIAPEFSAGARPSAQAFLLRAWRHTASLMLDDDRMRAHESLKHAMQDYQSALEAAPDDPEILAAAGTFFTRLPESWGGRPEFGRRCLQRADALCGASALPRARSAAGQCR
jgi:hypothetical protein